MGSHIEEAKSGRASCRSCKKVIAKGELRLGVEAANAFGDTPAMQWHHLPCAATKLPKELDEALIAYPGDVPTRGELAQAIVDAIAKGHAKPAGLPAADRAPTGRARCLHCREPIEKDSLRIGVERELEVGATVQSGAGYLHPACVGGYLEAKGAGADELVAAVRTNSRLAPVDLDAVIAAIGQ